MLEFQRRERSMWAGGVKDGLNIIPWHYCTLETTVLVLKLERDESQHREPYLPSAVPRTTVILGDWINIIGLGRLTLLKWIYSCTIYSGPWHNPFSLYPFFKDAFLLRWNSCDLKLTILNRTSQWRLIHSHHCVTTSFLYIQNIFITH